MWEAAPAAYAAVICFATDVGSTNVLEFEHVSGELLREPIVPAIAPYPAGVNDEIPRNAL